MTIVPASKRPTGMTAFTIVWAGQLVSVLTSSTTQFALTIWSYHETGGALRIPVKSSIDSGSCRPAIEWSNTDGGTVKQAEKWDTTDFESKVFRKLRTSPTTTHEANAQQEGKG